MLLGLLSICILGGVVYCAFRKTWRAAGTYLLYEIKYNILGMLAIIHDLWNAKYNKIDLPSTPGKVAIVTGGSRGIGAIVVKKLLQCDMEVIIACRTIIAGEKTILQIRKSGVTNGQAKVYELDNSSLESVREFAERIKKEYDKVHILINNAGVMFVPYHETKDGFEEQWAVNYLSHFLLTSLLLPLLETGGRPDDCSRIINVTSCAYMLGDANFNDINCKGNLTQAVYANSIVKTDLFNNSYVSKVKLLMIGFKTPEQGAIPIVYTAVNKDIEKKGVLYISNCRENAVLPVVLDTKIQQQLFNLSLKQAQLNDFFQYL
ncbi:dehydrogenase/reductase SDR family member on chromosome X-like isoform X2 [Odontomachus brunneus]|uniref:dehydrogenase/reductase SDR family member on chromosome X-like isoform X2 n=1 Tax=Odontomachus brunneus TaxID=486640 RepID=UPI0013F1F5F5|nr:dehydrogenase/reductase SDR family member on chromosome X-like isoform X2 [Odontomachus brunneus]